MIGYIEIFLSNADLRDAQNAKRRQRLRVWNEKGSIKNLDNIIKHIL